MATWHEVKFRQEWVPLGTFWSLDWDSPDDSLEATVTARDRMELLRKMDCDELLIAGVTRRNGNDRNGYSGHCGGGRCFT